MHDERMHKVQPIIGGGGICNRPHVYLSDNPNKLPTDAVDGSLAMMTCEAEGILGTWVFNEIIEKYSSDEVAIQFESNGSVWSGMSTVSLGPPAYGLRYFNSGGAGITVHNYEQEQMYGFTAGWVSEVYKTINILTELDNADFVTWLNNNATHTSSVLTFLYSRENGEWVSLGEVDFTNLSSS